MDPIEYVKERSTTEIVGGVLLTSGFCSIYCVVCVMFMLMFGFITSKMVYDATGFEVPNYLRF